MKSLFHPLERTFHRLERVFHRLKCTFHQLEHKFHHREKTFIALCYNNLSTMFQQCCNIALFGAYNRGEKSSSAKVGRLNSLGLSYPGIHCRSASFRRYFLDASFSHGFKNPRLFAFGTASFRRIPLLRRLHFLNLLSRNHTKKMRLNRF